MYVKLPSSCLSLCSYPPSSEPETQVMDYQTQQYKLLPLIAATYAFLFAGDYMVQVYNETWSEISKGNFDSMAEV